jgi:hypothetical protein
VAAHNPQIHGGFGRGKSSNISEKIWFFYGKYMRDHGKLSSSLAEFFGQENVYIAVLPRCGMMSHIIYMVIHAHIFIYYMHINIYIYISIMDR